MKLEGIISSEIRQIERGKYCMISHVETQTSNLEKTKLRETEQLGIARGGVEVGEMGKDDQKVHTCSYNSNKLWGCYV